MMLTTLASALFIALGFCTAQVTAQDRTPNIVIIFADDMGYGDMSAVGHPTIHTPNLDTMAAQGQRWTDFYVAACVCTPSRAGLLTGRLPIRSGMCSNQRRGLFPNSKGGLPASEVTIAEMLKEKGYATAIVGKWHLGHLPEFLPTRHGFDSYFGIPYSNDMDRGKPPLMRDEEVIEEQIADQRTLTRRYTEAACRKIDEFGDKPFFLYLAHTMPHIPLFASEAFRGTSRRGLYGDVIEEIDWSVGQVLAKLRANKLSERTLVIFTSDNGPWLSFKLRGGSAGLLRDGKGSTWEGGMREPAIFWWPGKLKRGIVHAMGSTLDLLPTIAKLCGAELPRDRILDGGDLSPVLFGTGASPRKTMYYYHGQRLFAVRHGEYKAHFSTKTSYKGQKQATDHSPPLLFHLGYDPSELWSVTKHQPDVIAELTALAQAHTASIKPVVNQLNRR